MVFTDSNTAMIKCRQFADALAQAAFAMFGIPGMPDKQYQRLRMLLDQGALPPRVHGWFDAVRRKGNQAVHEGYEGQREALVLLRACYELGAWYHRTVTPGGDAPPFVPPQPPQAQPEPQTPADAQAQDDMRTLLEAYRSELVEMRLRVDRQTEMATAEAAAQRTATQEILQAVRGQTELGQLVQDLSTQVSELQRRLTDRASSTTFELDSAARESLLARSQLASRPPLNEVQVRRIIDRMLTEAGWAVQDVSETNLYVSEGVAIREASIASGRADYLLYVDRKLVGVIEAKREGMSLQGVDQQSDRYATGLTSGQRLAAWKTPLPFRYESTAVETQFTNGLDPIVRPRRVFSFHQPSTIARWMRDAEANADAPTLRARFQRMPPLRTDGLRRAQEEAIKGLERSLAQDHARALIQMATGAGKTYTVVNESYRLLKHAGAKRVLFLVDRNNLGKQAENEFRNFVTPEEHTRFTELYNVQRLTSGTVMNSAHVVISTVQRLFAMLRGEELPPEEDEDPSDYDIDELAEVAYNAQIPPEMFDLVIVDECHRSIYGKWRAVLEYFDVHLVGLTATPVAQTFGFFHENLVSQYTYRQAVTDGVNVDYDVLRIRTEVGEQGGSIPANTPVRIVDLHTRRERYEQLDTNFDYSGDQIGRSVMNLSQIRKVIETFAREWPSFFPNRRHVPKTLVFAKTDKHADDIIDIIRDVFGGDRKFCAKITYKADNPDQLLKDFRNDAGFRIAVTVDMIATGTDVKPLECVLFLRGVSSATYFEQMKGRGARTIDPDEFQSVTPDARAKEKFLLVDAVGVTDSPLVDARPLLPATQRQVSLEKLLNRAASHSITTEEASALASRLSRLNQQITPDERTELAQVGGQALVDVARGLEQATDDEAQEAAFQAGGAEAQRELVLAAIRPLATSPEFRDRILSIRRKYDLPYDEHTIDKLISTEARHMDTDTSRQVIEDWRAYIEEHQDEITALRLAFSDPRRSPRDVYSQLADLARRIQRPPHQWTPDVLWKAYRKLGVAQGNGGPKGVPELMNILRYELQMDSELRTYRSRVEENLARWLAQQEQSGVRFRVDQVWWIERISHAIANRLGVIEWELEGVPFHERGGIGGFVNAFGDDRAAELLDELNKELSA
ncbi:DEAD/DEAH box helicase family protein [Amycolatopsis magusensis]|uniref:DEAD/DEAH box helicase family protein n=1 Tax=Amycolatopsis magusensis TaxID=882444 RepID=UPI0037B05584